MKRREFIALSAARRPGRSRPTRSRGMPVVGFLRSTRREGFANLTEAVRAGLKGKRLRGGPQRRLSNTAGGTSKPDRLPALAAELIRKPVAVIVVQPAAGAGGQGRDRDGADRVRDRKRSGERRIGDELQPARRQRHRHQLPVRRNRRKAAGAAAPARARRGNDRRDDRSGHE